MESTAFTCSVDRQNRIVTILVIGLLVIVPIVLLAASEGRSGTIASALVLVTIVVIIPIIVYGNLPRRMVVTRDAILLKCPFRTKVIPRDAETEVRRVRDYDVQSLWRKCGSGGVFGYWGLYASKWYPRMHFYAKRKKRDWILLSSAGRVYVLAPDDGEAFLELFD